MVVFWNLLKRNRAALLGLGVVLFFVIVALLAPILAPHDPTEIFDGQLKLNPIWSSTLSPELQAPNSNTRFLLGTDDVGRDLLSRLIYGARVSLLAGFVVVLLSGAVGVSLGLWAGFREGRIDAVISRLTDILMSLPSILLSIVVVAVLGQSFVNALLAVSVTLIPSFVRLVRASVLAEKEKAYVQASRSFGATDFRLAVLTILPNCLGPILVQMALGFSDGILSVAALGFLGLGAQAPTPEWGVMLADARSFIETSPWLVTLPGLCILMVVIAFNLLGDGLRDALDPRLKNRT